VLQRLVHNNAQPKSSKHSEVSMEGVAAGASNRTRPLKNIEKEACYNMKCINSPQKWSKHKETTHFQSVAAAGTQCTTKIKQT
jgi:hypothetical protein